MVMAMRLQLPHSSIAGTDFAVCSTHSLIIHTPALMSLAAPTDPSALFTWKIENCSKLKAEKLYSQIFYCGGFKWRLIAYPKVSNRQPNLSPNLQSLLLVEKAVVVGFPAVAVVVDPGTADTEHEFNAGKRSWGFHSFLPLVKLYDPKEGFLVNDTIVLEAGVTIPNSHDSKKETGFEPEKKKRKKETGDNGSGNVEADITGTSPSPQSMLQSILGSHISFAGKVSFLSYWVSSEALLVLEKIHSRHEGTYFKFSMKGQALPTMLLESFAVFIASMSSTKVKELNEEALRLAANSVEDFEQVGLDLRG
ncbi:hypothetical protein RHSIM_Rhsim05G0177000 [Rhododendron simsii]|uniref:MATH domain-containing protein n=1 Tax=Rhododendron simsii TaxID=118357 RepID=A0A834H7Y3_RHOSS|nr:hypothetical protein RHSIM_Rhsim05G0177000 [Rhododendron simsii]